MKTANIILLIVIIGGLYLFTKGGGNITKNWPRTLKNELKGWKTAYFTKTPLAGSSHAA